jgi:hypothetical protein
MGGRARLTARRSVRFTTLAVLAALVGFVALVVSMSERGDAAFPGANGRIVYSYGDAYSTSIWSSNPDGSAPTGLSPGNGYYEPTYSASGSRIAMSREGRIFVMNSGGSGLTQIAGSSGSPSFQTKWQEGYDDPHSEKVIPVVKFSTVTNEWRSFFSPSFSPDGSRLAVASSHGSSVYVAICGVKAVGDEECLDYGEEGAYFDYEGKCNDCGSNVVAIDSTSGAVVGELTPNLYFYEDYDPAYSADGKLAFTRWGGITARTIFATPTPGAPPVEVATGGEPDFSPDGSRIVFSRGGGEIGIVGAGGGPVSILAPPLPPGTVHSEISSPVFSPDGSRIAFQRSAYGPAWKLMEAGVFTVAVDGSGLAKVVNGASGPSWQPVAPPPPPAVKAKAKGAKGKVRLNRKHKATIGTIVCGSSPCTLKLLSAKLKVGKKKFAGKVKFSKRLGAGKKSAVKATVIGKALAALENAGKGRLVVKVQVIDAGGKTVLTLKAILLPPKKQAKKGKH